MQPVTLKKKNQSIHSPSHHGISTANRFGRSQPYSPDKKMNHLTDPESIVQTQLNAFNACDVEALLSVYAKDAQLFEHPSTLLATGTAELRKRYSVRFQEPNLHAELLSRIVSGAIVVDHERVTRTFPEGAGQAELVMIYEVQNGKIARAWSIAGPKTIFPRQ